MTSDATVPCFSKAGFNITDHNLNVEYNENDEEDSQEVQTLMSPHPKTSYIVTMTSSEQVCWVQHKSNTGSTDKDRSEEIHKHMDEKQSEFYINIFILKREKNKCWLGKTDKMK